MTTEEICKEISGSSAGEAYYKCLTLVPDSATHPHFSAPMVIGFFLAVGLIAIIALING